MVGLSTSAIAPSSASGRCRLGIVADDANLDIREVDLADVQSTVERIDLEVDPADGGDAKKPRARRKPKASGA